MLGRNFFSILSAIIPLLLGVAVTSSNVDEKSNSSSNQTGTITQFLKSQLALVNNMRQNRSSESENFDNKYKLLLSGDFPSELDIMNDSSEIDRPSDEHDILSSDEDDFFKLKFPEKDMKTGLKFDRKSENQNIYKVPKSRAGVKKFISSSLRNSSSEKQSNFQQFTHLYDHFTWNFENLNSSEMSGMCREDIQLFLNSLRNSDEWAVKASDASGRFRGLFYFDNEFWLGSKDLCNEVNLDNAKNRKIPRLQFYVVKMLIKFENMKSQRLLHVGQCLPDTCKVHEISQIMSYDPASISFKQKNELIIMETRKVPGDFDILQNTKFYVFW